jgi:glycosyltransferase involved in cell wall biosynthesis
MKNKSCITLVIDAFGPGGSQQVYLILIREYVTLFETVNLIILHLTESDLEIQKFENLNVFYLNTKKFLDIKNILLLRSHLNSFQSDYIIASIYRSQIWSSIVKPRNSKLIWVEQNTYHSRSWAQWFLMRVLSFRVSRIISTSKEILRISCKKITNSRIKNTLLPNPINVFQAKPICSNRNNDFVFVGRMVNQKNPFFAIESFAYFIRKNDIKSRLHLIGDGLILKDVIDYSENLGIRQFCEFYGNISIEEMVEVLSESKTLISTSLIEGFGLARLEALSLGCCVVSTSTGGVIDYLQEFENDGVFISKLSIEEFANFMKLSIDESFWINEKVIKRIDSAVKFNGSELAKKWISI